MKILKNAFFLMALIVVGCQNNIAQVGKKSLSKTNKLEKREVEKKTFPVLSCDSVVINNEFSLNALAFDVFKADTSKIKSLFVNPVTLKLEKRKNSEGGLYDQYNFTDGVNKLSLYNNNGFYLEEGDITNAKVLLNNKISIGMAKDVFVKLVQAKDIKCNTIIVENDELTFETVYIFNNAKLKQIKIGQILE